ncbi:MAG TPA: response regulator transcription factor [Solirubrobacteraceae bacterium]|jgi:DNA-binding NarL/FixJ family response regulator|nr:response regulator transcription factor [Solirubrobacteraceae bacterium]
MPVPFPVRILIADDHAVVRGGLRLLLDSEPDLKIVAEVDNGADAVQRCLEGDIDLAILDIAMPRLTGLQAARELSRRCPGLRTLILSMHDREQYVSEGLLAGASGYVAKRAADKDIVDACRAAIRGADFVYPSTLPAQLRDKLEQLSETETLGPSLTARESEVTKLVAEGHSSQAIADMLVLSSKTVETHRANIHRKLGIRDRVELTRYAIREGLIDP